MLRCRNSARWLALAWVAFHVIVGALHSVQQFAIHCLFCAVIAWFLFRPEARRYFRVPVSQIGAVTARIRDNARVNAWRWSSYRPDWLQAIAV